MEWVSSSNFETLLSQLSVEHYRIVASLKNEISRLRNDADSSSSLKLRPHDESDTKVPVGHTITNEAVISFTASMESSRAAVVGTKSKSRPPSINLNVSEYKPKREYWSAHLAFQIAQCMGLATHQIESFIVWWSTLEEPVRTGRCARLVHSAYFQGLSLFMITLNMAVIASVTDHDMAKFRGHADRASFLSGGIDIIIEGFFATFYCVELLLKLAVHRKYFFIGHSWKWNWFDLVLVVFSLFDLSGEVFAGTDKPNVSFLRAFRVLKMARVLRVLRILKSIQELRLVLECILSSFHHLVWCIALLDLFLFMFALVLVQGITHYLSVHKDTMPEQYEYFVDKFGTVMQAIISLFMATTGGWDWREQYDFMGEMGIIYEIFYLFYITFFVIAVWNVVLSSFVEKAFRLALPDLDMIILEKKQENIQVADELERLLKADFHKDHDDCISKSEFQERMSDEDVVSFFEARGIGIKDVLLFFNMVASTADSANVPLAPFVNTCVKLRGFALNVDLHALHYDMRSHSLRLEQRLKQIEALIQGIKRPPAPTQVDIASNPHPNLSL